MSRVRPILFNTEMVQDILEDYKTDTRRLIRPRYQKHETGFECVPGINVVSSTDSGAIGKARRNRR